jgi:hypothetical protein
MENLLIFIGALICMIIGILTATGHIQAYIPFAGVSNEMAFCFCAFMLAGILMICLLPNKKQRSGGS